MKHITIKSLITLPIFIIATTIVPFVGSTNELVIVNEYGDNESLEATLGHTYDGTFAPDGIGAASDIVLTALYQNVPVLTPAALWNNIVNHKQLFDAMVQKSMQEIKKMYGKTPLLKTTHAITMFKGQCMHAQARYEHCIKYLHTCSTKEALQNAISHDTIYQTDSDPTSLFKDWKHWEHVLQYLMCSIVPVDRFTVFAVTLKEAPHCPFLLFLPKTTFAHAPAPEPLTKSLSQRERYFGLKIDHCTLISDPFTCMQSNFEDSYLDLLPSVCKTLFVQKHEVSSSEQKHWCFYVMGHGIYDHALKNRTKRLKKTQETLKKQYAVANNAQTKQALQEQRIEIEARLEQLRYSSLVLGMPLDTVQKLLHFFDTSISTKALFFTSCSSGGQQAIDTFKNSNGSPLQLSYPVITDTLAEAPLLRAVPHLVLYNFDGDQSGACPLDLEHLIDWESKKIILDTPYDFELLFKLAHEKQVTSDMMDVLLRSFAPTHPCRMHGTALQTTAVPASIRKQCKRLLTTGCCLHTNNHCALRVPRASMFSLIGPAQLIDGTKSTITTTTPLIMMASDHIPNVTIHKSMYNNQCPALISALPGKASHTIDIVNAPDYCLSEIIAALTSCEELNVPKVIHIKKLICKDDCLEETMKQSENELYCFISCGLDNGAANPVNHVVATQNNKTYHHCWDFNKPLLDYQPVVCNQINDGTTMIAHLMQPFANHTNSNKQFIGNIIDTNELIYQLHATRING